MKEKTRTCRSSEGKIRAGETRPVVQAGLAREVTSHISVTYSTKGSAFSVGALIGPGILIVLCAVTIAGDDKNTKNVSHVGIGRRLVRFEELERSAAVLL
jgi:hypothetical protein